MKGVLDYHNSSGKAVSLELNKGQTSLGNAPGSAVIEWQPTRCTWSIHSVEDGATLIVHDRRFPTGARAMLEHLDVVILNDISYRFLKIPATPVFKFKACQEIELRSGKLVIGRDERNSPDEDTTRGEDRWYLDPEDRSISKIHVEIVREAQGFVIIDRSKTGTYLNGTPFNQKRLVAGDRFNIGNYFFVFTGTSVCRVDQVSGARIEGRNLVVDVQHGKRILRGISIEIRAGEFVGVLGGSGQGKSTLMNLLAGLKQPTSGTILMDGVPLGASSSPIGFVPQDDIVHHELTVTEALTFTARMRLSESQETIGTLVQGLIARLGLENQRHQAIHSLSGGQRKRVNIATELITRPPVLFLDEPTSGLDPANEESVIASLQNLRLTGQTVVCTTHSLHKAYLFDRVAFIHAGQLMFLGTLDEARQHFLDDQTPGGTGPAMRVDRIYDLFETEEDTEHWAKKFAQSPLAPFRSSAATPPRCVVPTVHTPKIPGSLQTLWVLMQTQWRILMADPRNWKSLLLQALGIGALAGWVGRDDPEFRFFACLIATLWFGCSNAAQTITRELPIFRRERIAGLGLHSYILSKTTFLSIIACLQVILLLSAQALPVCVGFGMTQADNPCRDLFPGTALGIMLFFVAFGMASIVGVMIGLSLSSHARTTTQATLWVPLVLIPQILFSGFVVPLPEMPAFARAFSYAIPSASAQRLLDAGNLAGQRVPLMTDQTEVPMFFWTDFAKDSSGRYLIAPGTNEKKLKPQESTGTKSSGRKLSREATYRELDEYGTAWQNLAVESSKIGTQPLPAQDANDDNYVTERFDVRQKAGTLFPVTSTALTGTLTLLGWAAICYAIIWLGLFFAQPETLRRAQARPH